MSDQSQDYEPNFVYDYGPEKPKHNVEPKTESKSAGDNWWGIVLVGIGLYFLLSSLNIIPNDFNWWALFIVFPGLAMLLKSWSAYNRAGFLPDDIKSEAVSGF